MSPIPLIFCNLDVYSLVGIARVSHYPYVMLVSIISDDNHNLVFLFNNGKQFIGEELCSTLLTLAVLP